MKRLQLTATLLLISLFAASLAPMVSTASTTPTLNAPPSSLPVVTYYINGTANHYTISNPQWQILFSDVINNKTLISYNWSQNTTEDLIVFDLSYGWLNTYGAQLISALSFIGAPTAHNFTLAFQKVANSPSLVKRGGTTLTNIQALNAGAYPGFSWSQAKVKSSTSEYRDAAIIVVIVAATFFLYYYFNRGR